MILSGGGCGCTICAAGFSDVVVLVTFVVLTLDVTIPVVLGVLLLLFGTFNKIGFPIIIIIIII